MVAGMRLSLFAIRAVVAFAAARDTTVACYAGTVPPWHLCFHFNIFEIFSTLYNHISYNDNDDNDT